MSESWEERLGQPLVHWERGQAATLTPFAEKLIWTERLAQARLTPQIEALRAELARTFALAFDPDSHVLPLYASHDDALALLQAHAAEHARLHLDIRFCGSVQALHALNEGRCVIAGFHTREQAGIDSPAAHALRLLLTPGRHKLLGFAQRWQGLIVPAGNPRRLRGLADVARWRLRFVNRPEGTGTRLLLDGLLHEAGLQPQELPGYDRCAPSHVAMAQTVASGAADAGLGTQAAAQRLGLGFVPLVRERHDLACLKTALEQPGLRALRQVLSTPGWQARLADIPGYAPLDCGAVLSLTATLMWWRLPPKARPRPAAGSK
ncbi:MAG: substrate-binding domain-containing protein [Tepidimonas sp.]|uniref:substrate-binding domain-containing protein n=1 Tax=Tepidimonas sp. TaxID=2002775 RepID=UPI00259D78A6|nr:substrate-binding domain-containing protein [Tepidimonas sp.]MDM7456891.1 substrate-binding domain-containing protein [Tepidimonas sp.]